MLNKNVHCNFIIIQFREHKRLLRSTVNYKIFINYYSYAQSKKITINYICMYKF